MLQVAMSLSSYISLQFIHIFIMSFLGSYLLCWALFHCTNPLVLIFTSQGDINVGSFSFCWLGMGLPWTLTWILSIIHFYWGGSINRGKITESCLSKFSSIFFLPFISSFTMWLPLATTCKQKRYTKLLGKSKTKRKQKLKIDLPTLGPNYTSSGYNLSEIKWLTYYRATCVHNHAHCGSSHNIQIMASAIIYQPLKLLMDE